MGDYRFSVLTEALGEAFMKLCKNCGQVKEDDELKWRHHFFHPEGHLPTVELAAHGPLARLRKRVQVVQQRVEGGGQPRPRLDNSELFSIKPCSDSGLLRFHATLLRSLMMPEAL